VPEGLSARLYSPPDPNTRKRELAEASSSRLDFIPYVAVPEELSARLYSRPDPNPSTTSSDQTHVHVQSYIQTAAPHSLLELPSSENYASPLPDSILSGVAGPPATIDGSSSEAGQGDPIEEGSPKKVERKGKQRANNLREEELPPLRRFKKKTEIACNFCRGKCF
jgi:hypothetical protein